MESKIGGKTNSPNRKKQILQIVKNQEMGYIPPTKFSKHRTLPQK